MNPINGKGKENIVKQNCFTNFYLGLEKNKDKLQPCIRNGNTHILGTMIELCIKQICLIHHTYTDIFSICLRSP